jgi:Leucine-rich repeat (LRR) protein
MKSKINFFIGTVLILALFTQCEKDKEFENIPAISDENFQQALINRGYDLNNDSIISMEEAEAVTFLNVKGADISDLTGIGYFINLETLICSGNRLLTRG